MAQPLPLWHPALQHRTLTSLYNEYSKRSEECWEKSAAIQKCKAQADRLFQAMATVKIEDVRINAAGEQSRILTRAVAMRTVLGELDPNFALSDGPASQSEGAAAGGRRPLRLPRFFSNEAEPEATPEDCLLSVCLLMAAMYEQTPFVHGELRKRIFDDFTTLKKHFRQDPLLTLHGRTGSIGELFDSIKTIDKRGGLENLIGILFEDYEVHQRADPFILADQLDVQVGLGRRQGPQGHLAGWGTRSRRRAHAQHSKPKQRYCYCGSSSSSIPNSTLWCSQGGRSMTAAVHVGSFPCRNKSHSMPSTAPHPLSSQHPPPTSTSQHAGADADH